MVVGHHSTMQSVLYIFWKVEHACLISRHLDTCTLVSYYSLIETILPSFFLFLFCSLEKSWIKSKSEDKGQPFFSELLCGFTVIQSIQRVSFTQIINSTNWTCNIAWHLWSSKVRGLLFLWCLFYVVSCMGCTRF